jgi:hypothetical protein
MRKVTPFSLTSRPLWFNVYSPDSRFGVRGRRITWKVTDMAGSSSTNITQLCIMGVIQFTPYLAQMRSRDRGLCTLNLVNQMAKIAALAVGT